MGTKLAKKVSSVVLSVTTIVWLSGFALFVPAANAQTTAQLIEQIRLQIEQLTRQLQTLQQGTPATPATTCTFSRNLTMGSKGTDVKCLQAYLNGAGFKIAESGPGSPGNETEFFGGLTKAQLARWQAANGVSPAVGFFGSISRAKYAALVVAPPPPPPPQCGQTGQPACPPPVSGTGLSVMLAMDQPAPGLFPKSSASVPFTNLIFTASADGDVTIDALTVQRTDSANNAAFDGVVALDENGVRMGVSKSLNSENKAILSDDFVVKAGQSRRITIAGDAVGGLNDYAGQLASLSLVGVTTKNNAAVTATFPLKGSVHTINDTLSIGTATLTRGPTDPGTGATKEVGTAGYVFASLKVTAGSAEKLRLDAVRWNQSGSAGNADLANVKISVDSQEFPVTTSDDGKYFLARFGDGIVVEKGLNKEIKVKADVVGGSNRKVDFDLYRAADLQVRGLTYGYSILPSASTTTADNDDDGEFQNAEPFFDAFEAHIGAGTIQVAASNRVPSQNIAENVAGQPLGAFDVIVKGEPVSVGKIVFRMARWNGSGASNSSQDITQIGLYDPSGNLVAGPVDIASSGAAVTFSDTVTFPVGTNTYTLKGKLDTDYANNDTVAASTTPSSDWSNVRGVNTNTSVTPTPSSVQASPTMTLKAGALDVAVGQTPVAQTIVFGTKNFAFARYVLNAGQSGEDLRITQMQPELNFSQSAIADDLTNCQLFNENDTTSPGADPVKGKALNTGTNILNPANSVATGDDPSINFDESLIVRKGTAVTLAFRCDTTSTTTVTLANSINYTVEIQGADANLVANGETSGTAIAETYSDTTGQQIDLTNSGTFTVVKGSLTSSSTNTPILAMGNTTGVLINDLTFNANREDIRIDQLVLTLDDAAGSSTPQDLAKVTLWDGTTKIGEMVFNGESATTSFDNFVIPKDSEKTVLVKADFARIGTSEPARPGHHVRVEFDGRDGLFAAASSTRGIGLSSGVTIPVGTANRTTSGGARIYKAVPTVAHIPLSSSERRLLNGIITLYKFKVTAPPQGGVGLYKFTFGISTSSNNGTNTFSVTQFQLYAYTNDQFSTPAYNSNGLLNNVVGDYVGTVIDGTHDVGSNPNGGTVGGTINAGVYFNPVTTTNDPSAATTSREVIQIPANTSYYFVLKGSANNMSATSSSIRVELLGDAMFGRGLNNTSSSADNWLTNGTYAFATTAPNIDLGPAGDGTNGNQHTMWHDDFIWSGNSTTTSKADHYDWANGFLLPGLPSSSSTAETLTP